MYTCIVMYIVHYMLTKIFNWTLYYVYILIFFWMYNIHNIKKEKRNSITNTVVLLVGSLKMIGNPTLKFVKFQLIEKSNYS